MGWGGVRFLPHPANSSATGEVTRRDAVRPGEAMEVCMEGSSATWREWVRNALTAAGRRSRSARVTRAARAAVERLEDRRLFDATLVKDIQPAVKGLETSQVTDVNGTAYFIVTRT